VVEARQPFVHARMLVRAALQADGEERDKGGSCSHQKRIYSRAVPRLTEALPGVGGAIKTIPEDFIVEEIPAYPPSGEGEHVFLTVEKRGVTTHEMVRRVARALGVPPTAIGTAGQKDRQAIARQVISVPGVEPARAANLKLEGVTVLSAARHNHKLRTGHLRGNRFHIVIRGVAADAEMRARTILDALAASWLPNAFGTQRFGRAGDNAAEGRALVRGARRVSDRFEKRLLLSAYQAALFNRYLEERAAEGLLHRVVTGEVLQRAATGGLFLCAAEELVLNQVRLESRQIVPTGPIFGHKMFAPAPGSAAAAREQHILDDEGLALTDFAAFGKLAEGTRRPLLVRVEGASARQEEDRLLVSFALPSGSYATVLLDELMKGGEAIAAPANDD
jgi:tRNA pseudouridine13 synthase